MVEYKGFPIVSFKQKRCLRNVIILMMFYLIGQMRLSAVPRFFQVSIWFRQSRDVA